MPANRRIRLTPTTEYLANPHKGCCTFQHFNGDALYAGYLWSEAGPTTFPPPVEPKYRVIDGYLPTTVAYCRWFWNLLEPEQGKYDFTVIEKSLETCAQRGQSLAVRLMSFGSLTQPQVPDWYAKLAPQKATPDHINRPHIMPDHDAPEYLLHWGNLIKAFAEKFDGNPLLESIDIAFVGPWGEGAGECSTQTCQKFADLFQQAFKHTPRMALIAGQQFSAGIASGAGWRCDCFGDLAAVGSAEVARHNSWNHTYDAYPFQVAAANAQDVWKTAPIHLETCYVPMDWHRRQFDIDFILQQGLKMHATYFMPKYTRLPDHWMDKLAAFCQKLGYRLVFRQANVDTVARRGQPYHFQAWIENVGVAPMYHPYQFALRFRQGERSHIVTLPNGDPRAWLPGDICFDQNIALPEGLEPGYADLSAGLISPLTKTAKIRFAVKETYADRWLPLTQIEVR